MVRVLSVYHFPAHQTKTVEDICDSCLIPGRISRLVLAKRSGLLEIHDLDSTEDEATTCFAAIEDIIAVRYSAHGHYLATLEARASEKGAAKRSVRVYCNFEHPQGACGIKVRIAGKVTPVYSTAETRCLEMLELPLKQPADLIACCQTTGNLFVAAGKRIFCYAFKFCYNESSKHRYIDFVEAPFVVELDFKPEKMQVAENIVAVMNSKLVHVVQIVGSGATVWSSSNEASTSSFPSDNNHNIELKQRINLDCDLDYNEIKDKREVNDQPHIVDISSSTGDRKTDVDSNEIKPLVISNLQCSLKFDEASNNNFDLQSLLQLKFDAMGMARSNGCSSLRFLCFTLQPIYTQHRKAAISKGMFESAHYENFVGCSLLVSTQQDGFLYMVYPDRHTNPKCFSFPFTSPLIDVALTPSTLHALTEDGIETYTVRTGHKLFHDGKSAVPSINKSICLIGLRPFLGVKKILLGDSHLVLLANSTPLEIPTWTVYSLQTPTPDMIYRDFEELAKKKFNKNRHAFIDLIEEAHIILRTSLVVAKVVPAEEEGTVLENNVTVEVEEMFKDSCILLGDLYALSGDSEEYEQSLPYYEMAGLTLMDIFKRMKTLQNGEMRCMSSLIYTLKTYLTHIVQECGDLDALLSTPVKYEEFISDDSESDPSRNVRFGEVILEILAKNASNKLAGLVLHQPAFMNYIGSHMFEVIKNFPEKSAQDVVCLVLYLTKRNDVEQAKTLLAELGSPALARCLKRHYNILFDVSISAKGGTRIVNFSDFAEIFFLTATQSSQQKLFIDVCLFVLNETQFIEYEAMLKLFMDYLSTLIGGKNYINGQNLVQDFLEKYFHQINVKRHLVCYKGGEDYTSMDIFSSNSEPTSLNSNSMDSDNSIRKSVRILIRLYLTHLKYAAKCHVRHNGEQRGDVNEEFLQIYDGKIDSFFGRFKSLTKAEEISTNKILFYERRNSYLDLMPPFEVNLLGLDAMEEPSQIRMEHDVYVNLLKLQAILCNQEISSDIYKDVAQFLQANPEVFGTEAILSCIYPTNVGVEFILDKCPQAIVAYGIDKFKGEADWTLLIKNLQSKVNSLDEQNNVPDLLLYYRVFRETLEYIAMSNPLEVTMKILCEDNYTLHNIENSDSIPNYKYMCDFSEFIHLCNDTRHSTKLKQMIEQTGHQLFEAINKNKIT